MLGLVVPVILSRDLHEADGDRENADESEHTTESDHPRMIRGREPVAERYAEVVVSPVVPGPPPEVRAARRFAVGASSTNGRPGRAYLKR